MIEYLEHIDRKIFLFCNSIHSELFDHIMWFVSGKLEWLPLYLLLVVLIVINYKKDSWLILLGIAVVIVLADQISVKLFKDVFERYRPCHNLEIKEIVHLVNEKCGGKFGFVSSHAANSFAMAVFVGNVLKKRYKYILVLLLLWAAFVSYSRVYLGVHYPSDIFFGGLLGGTIAFSFYKLISFKFKSKMI